MSKKLLVLHGELAKHLDAIKACFKPGAVVMVVIRNPRFESENEDADVVIGDDDMDKAIAAIGRAKSRANIGAK